jgi:hypothetical protein
MSSLQRPTIAKVQSHQPALNARRTTKTHEARRSVAPVRRFWPQTTIIWSLLPAGRFRDPLVGRDLLLGCILGVGLVLMQIR